MRVSTPLACLGLAAALVVSAADDAAAGGRFGGGRGFQAGGHHHPGRSGRFGYGGFGFVDGSGDRGDVSNTTVRLYPTVHELVPAAQGYGTYGVPTVAGITQAPIAAPTVYSIDGTAPVAAKRVPAKSRVLSRGSNGRWSDNDGEAGEFSGGARVVSMTVPRR